MTMNSRKGWQFFGGIAVGVAAGAAAVMMLLDAPSRDGAATATMGASAAPAHAAAAVAIADSECGRPPLLGKSGDDDGQARLQARPAGATPDEVASLILKGKEAAASQRQRDAEILFLNACRSAEVLKASQPVPVADAMYQLARHYANAAAFGAQPSRELYERAERLYSASVLAYTARHGASHEKTRFAQEGLKTVQQVTGRSGPVVPVAKAQPPKPAPAPAPAPATPAESAAPTAPVQAQVSAPAAVPAAPPAPSAAVAVPPPVVRAPARAAASAPAPAAPAVARTAPPQPPREAPVVADAGERAVESAPAVTAEARDRTPSAPQARRSNPSFDCDRARSTTERLICADEDLARQDRELGRLHQRARQAAADPRAFQRESDAQWQRREETCRDRECLQRWYAQRRAELGAAAARGSQPAPDAEAAPRRSQQTRDAAAAPRRSVEPPSTDVSGAGPTPPAPRRVRQPDPPTRPALEAPAVGTREPESGVEVPASPGVASGSAGAAPAAEGTTEGQ
jgi:uncharacterized protein